MPVELFLSPQGHLHVREAASPDGSALDGPAGKRIHAAFTDGSAHGLLHLATTELQSSLAAAFCLCTRLRPSVSDPALSNAGRWQKAARRRRLHLHPKLTWRFRFCRRLRCRGVST